MSDLNWCTYCDNAITSYSTSLYCSQDCLRADALNHHPLLGYDYAEFKNFPRSSSPPLSSCSSSSIASPTLSFTIPPARSAVRYSSSPLDLARTPSPSSLSSSLDSH